jgi:broad specificity phosphatase PhoE
MKTQDFEEPGAMLAAMAILYVVRHGRVASNPVDRDNPELGQDGRLQAEAVAAELRARLPTPLPILTSPLLRCRETAAPLCAHWGIEPVIEPRVAEVPGPPASAMPRDEWLRRALSAEWPELVQLAQTLQAGYDGFLIDWRQGVLEAVLARDCDTVIFSHFVPVNVLIGHATRSNRVACFLPDYTSITTFESRDGQFRLIEHGRAMQSRVN